MLGILGFPLTRSERIFRLVSRAGPVYGRPFVKRFALCYRTVVCPILSACLSCLGRWCIVAKRLEGSRLNLTWR